MLAADEAKRLPRRPFVKNKRDDAHADEVRAMNAFERLANHRANPQQGRSLGGPVTRGAGAVFLAGEYDKRNVLALISHRGVVNRQLIARRIMDRDAALDAWNHLIFDADVSESAPHHHFVVAASGPVLIEVGGLDLMVNQIFSRRRGGLNGSGRLNVTRGD